jgi:Beta propeller domain
VPSADKAPDYSTTNNQEAGVDEPDLAKTDGDTLFTVNGDTVYAISVRGESKIVGSLKLDGYGGQLMLRGHRLVAITEQGGFVYERPVAALAPIPYGYGKTVLTEIDVSDPAAMKVSRQLTFDGSFAAARQNGGTIRVVLNSTPLAYTQTGIVDTARGWLPRSHFVSNVTGRKRTRAFVPCGRVSRPPVFSGLGMLSIVTLNLDKGLWQEDSDGVMTDAQTVYGSTKHLYVATQRWIDPNTPATELPSDTTTLISRFDVGDPDRTIYEGSGSVPGYLLNQYSLSEGGGDLRVATTTQPVWWNGAEQEPSRSMVTVLRGANLNQVGQVDGLGHGQRIYSVRFAGDVGYVVTFRQVDPLYVIDLSDPEHPRVRGELEIPGYSAYLHPVGAGRLLGVGGGDVSLFDVSDPSAPKLLDRHPLGSSSAVEYDPHAFLWWAPKKLALLPLSSEMVGLRVTDKLAEAGRIAQEGAQRAIVVGGRIYTISDAGVTGSDIDTFGMLSFVAFPQQPIGGPVEPQPGSPQPAASAAR